MGIAAPRVLTPQGRLHLSLRREPTLPRALGLTRTRLAVFSEYVCDPSAYTRPCTVDWALGAALLMSRECYEALGGWDETYFLYSEETDLSLRARDAGLLTRYEPRAVAVHIGGQSGRSHRTHAMQIVNRVRLYRRRHGALASWAYYWLVVANQMSRVPRGRRRVLACGCGAAQAGASPGRTGLLGQAHATVIPPEGQRGPPGLTDPDAKTPLLFVMYPKELHGLWGRSAGDKNGLALDRQEWPDKR